MWYFKILCNTIQLSEAEKCYIYIYIYKLSLFK
jgi:hypothetical protein